MSSPLIDIIIIIWLNYDYSIMSSPFMSLRIEYMASFSWLSFWPLIDLKNRLIFLFIPIQSYLLESKTKMTCLGIDGKFSGTKKWTKWPPATFTKLSYKFSIFLKCSCIKSKMFAPVSHFPHCPSPHHSWSPKCSSYSPSIHHHCCWVDIRGCIVYCCPSARASRGPAPILRRPVEVFDISIKAHRLSNTFKIFISILKTLKNININILSNIDIDK